MATAGAIVTRAFENIGALGQGETLQAALAQDGLRRLNNMVASWQTQFGTVLAVERQIFPLIANQQTYTIGLGGDFNVPQPVAVGSAGLWLNGLAAPLTVTSITRSGSVATVTQTSHPFTVGDEAYIAGALDPAYNGLQTVQTVPSVNTYTFTVSSTATTPAAGTLTAAAVNGQPVEIPRAVITDEAYQSIQIKNLSNPQFTLVYYDRNGANFGFGTVFLWPKPNTAENQLVLYLQSVFASFANLHTDYSYPNNPGYAEALEYNLSFRLAEPYGRSLATIPGIVEMARESLGLIKRANTRMVDLPNDAALFAGDRRGGYNINTGE